MASPWPLTFSSGERPRALWALLFSICIQLTILFPCYRYRLSTVRASWTLWSHSGGSMCQNRTLTSPSWWWARLSSLTSSWTAHIWTSRLCSLVGARVWCTEKLCTPYNNVFMPPPFEEWWRGIKCYPCLCVRPCVRLCIRPSVRYQN